MLILVCFCIIFYTQSLAYKTGRGIAYLGSRTLGFDPFLVPFEKLYDQARLRDSHFRYITPSKYDDFLSHKLIAPYSIFPDFFISRRYKLIWKWFSMENGITNPLTGCSTFNNGICTTSSLKVQIKDYDPLLSGIRYELVLKMIGWTYKNITYYQYTDSATLLQTENSTRLTFTPMMIHLEAAISVCDLNRFYWPWEETEYDCMPFIFQFKTPVVAQDDQSKALGKVQKQICKT